jgi:hypothetical protein
MLLAYTDALLANIATLLANGAVRTTGVSKDGIDESFVMEL